MIKLFLLFLAFILYFMQCEMFAQMEDSWMGEDNQSFEEEDFQQRQLRVSILPSEKELKILRGMRPLKNQTNYIVFWRPQKVGSSTLLSILMSYAYRYNAINKRKASPNSFCRLIAQCALDEDTKLDSSAKDRLKLYTTQKIPGNPNVDQKTTEVIKKAESVSASIPYYLVSTHELCALETEYVQSHLSCAFGKGSGVRDTLAWQKTRDQRHPVKQLFLVREPLSRAISIYYFWGELSKMVLSIQSEHRMLAKGKKKKSKGPKLGSSVANQTVEKGMFRYHGVETAVPPLQYALDFANKFPYRVGMPGPSFTWSAFARNVDQAISHIQSDNMLTLVLERLDESLVVAVHYLNWSIADAVVAMPRKSLSSHPKYTAWPEESISLIRKKLEKNGEFRVYDASRQQLDDKIKKLKEQGVDIQAEVKLLTQLRNRVSKICKDTNYLDPYKRELNAKKLTKHPSENKLRDVDEVYSEKGHLFSLNREILGTFDICGNCEAHALLYGIKLGLATSVETSTTLFELDQVHRIRNVDFLKCPLNKE